MVISRLDVFAKTVDLVQDLKIDIPRYSINTPYPGSRLFKRLTQEGRILSTDWRDYDTMHVVFKPAKMTPEELYTGFKWAYKETFRIDKIFPRTLASGTSFPITFVGNLAYRIFVRKLQAAQGFEMPLNL